ncbi:Hsp70 family protein [Ectobacillus ponti]|uniref:Chaperone protein DnaK n=1 Tax=Ectobacillus ponti TaxID=2961894 RepID=A0AA41XCP2_9BACI|nr:Hsp70 family protein [Ectobacillus ponti]MCP8970909.1 Hsp70 family protein [Ectobacillus ponti]
MTKSKRYVGIDLGTTNSTVSIAELTASQQVQAKTLQVQQYDGHNMTFNEILPSTVYFDSDSIPYVGSYAKRMQCVEPEQVMSEVKRHIGDEVAWPINNENYAPEHISSFVLKKLKKTVEEKFFGEEVDGAVITVPANFNFQKQAKTKIAAELAGFNPDKIHMIPEPTAALIDFLHEENEKAPEHRALNLSTGPKTILVFDLGGGTCDVTIHRVTQGQDKRLRIEDLSISQYTELGGMNFDKEVHNYMLRKLLKQQGVSPKDMMIKYGSEISQVKAVLLDFAETAKMQFSRQVTAREEMLDISYYDQPGSFDQLKFSQTLFGVPAELMCELSITKQEMDQIIQPLLYKKHENDHENIEHPILNALSTAVMPLQAADIDHVFLVGGMTAFPAVRGRIYEIFGKKPTVATNPMYSVSRGAAIYHYYQDQEGIQLAQVSEERIYPQNVYIRVLKGTPVALIKKGDSIPYDKTFEQGFFVTGNEEYVSRMELSLFAGESPDDLAQQPLKNAVLEFENPVRVGSPLVLRVEVDKERNLSVKAWLKHDESEMIHVNVGVRKYTEEEKERINGKHMAMTK